MIKYKVEKPLHIGVIGAGYMGKSHAHAYRNLAGHPLHPRLYAVATSNIASAKHAAEAYNFPRYTDCWRLLCEDEQVDVVCVTSPNQFHLEQAQYALECGKKLSLEKPLVISIAELAVLNTTAKAANTTINIGYNYLHNPMLYYAKQLIQTGKIGALVSFRVIHSEDFLAQQASTFKSWHIDKSVGGGVVRDIGSHPLSMVNYLIGDVQRVCAIGKRQFATRGPKHTPVTVEDHIDVLIAMDDNLQGTLTASWIGSGRGMNLGFEIYGSQGALCFNQERLNELQLYVVDQHNLADKGALTLRAGQHHPEFDVVCPGNEHGIGFMDLKILEAKNYLDSILQNKQPITSLAMGLKVEQQIAAIYQSIAAKNWIDVCYEIA